MDEKLGTTSGQQYLDKDFSTELNFNFWTTKGARFIASHRLKTINKLSLYSIGFLSTYLIILGLLSFFENGNKLLFTTNYLPIISISISILILIFSQLEGSNNYRLRAEKFHDCALEIGNLYNKLRCLKTSTLEKEYINKQSENLSFEYNDILKKYENHKYIDYLMFQTTKKDYFKLKKIDIINIKLRYYLSTQFLYHTLIIIPPILIYCLVK